MAASQQPYLTLSDAKAYLNIADTDDSQDMFLTNTIQYVQGFIDRYTGRTFGWGDKGDSATIDYSNSDNIGIISATLIGNILTMTLMGGGPWKIGQNVSVFNTGVPAYNGVWAVTAIPGFSQISVDISVSKGTLSPSNNAANTNSPAPNFFGYIGNYVQNYAYKTQDQYDGYGGNTIWLRNMDIRSIDTLYIGLRNIAQPVLLDHTQYSWRDDGRLILGGSFFNTVNSGAYDPQNSSFYGSVASGYGSISISYWYGYAGLPPEVSMAAADMVSTLYVLRKSTGVHQESIGDYSVRYDLTLRAQLKDNPDSFGNLGILRRLHVGT